MICPQDFSLTIDVVGNQAAGSVENVLGRTVVLFEFDDFGTGEIRFKAENIFNVRASKTIDGLVFVPDSGNVLVNLGQISDQIVLRTIGILILVNQDMTVPLPVTLPHLRVPGQQPHGQQKEVVKVHGVGALEKALIGAVDKRDFLAGQIA